VLHHKGRVSKHLEEANSTITETTSAMSGPDKQRSNVWGEGCCVTSTKETKGGRILMAA